MRYALALALVIIGALMFAYLPRDNFGAAIKSADIVQEQEECKARTGRYCHTKRADYRVDTYVWGDDGKEYYIYQYVDKDGLHSIDSGPSGRGFIEAAATTTL